MYHDPKQMTNMFTKWLQDNKVNVLQWSSQRPDLNPIENSWAEPKRLAQTRRLTKWLSSVRRNGPKLL